MVGFSRPMDGPAPMITTMSDAVTDALIDSLIVCLVSLDETPEHGLDADDAVKVMECVADVFNRLSTDDKAALAELLRTRADSDDYAGFEPSRRWLLGLAAGYARAAEVPGPESTG